MPHSLVLNFSPISSIPPGFTAGKHMHGLFLNLVSAVDEELGDRLHKNQANKPFTLSPLQITPKPRAKPIPKASKVPSSQRPSQAASRLRWNYRQPLTPGTPCWWRISLLDDRLFGQLSPLWLNLNPEQPWHLGPADLRITSVLGTPQSTQPWANFCDYAQLHTQASESDRKLTLQFFTPTAFRQGKYDALLPTPERVFGSLLRRWNAYSDLPFSEEILTFVGEGRYDIRSEKVTDPRGQFQHTGAKVSPCNQFVGSVGKVTYQLRGKVEPDTIKQLNTLADYALYAGVGRKTPMGMGVVKRVDAV